MSQTTVFPVRVLVGKLAAAYPPAELRRKAHNLDRFAALATATGQGVSVSGVDRIDIPLDSLPRDTVEAALQSFWTTLREGLLEAAR